MVMGLVDDIKNLDWRLRLGIQVGCAAVLAATGIRITLFGPFTHPVVGGAVTVLWIVGLTNAFNMLDNMDGLAASVGLIAASLFCGAQVAVGDLFVPAVLLVVVGALGGFLVHNRPPARLFMGDAGSNFLGFLLGTLTVVGTFTREGYSACSVLAPLLVMAVPLYDMSSVILIRLREGRSPFKADRRHFSHRLVARGLTPSQAVWTIDLVTLAGGLGALLLTPARLAAGRGGDGPDRLPAGRRGHPGSRGEPIGARQWPDAGRSHRSPSTLPRRGGPTGSLSRSPRSRGRPIERDEPDFAATAARVGERIRRVALGLTAALVTARAYTTSEPDLEHGAGAGLIWILALLIVAGLAIAAGLIGGRFRFRWSWADAAVVALMLLVAFSSRHALDRRPAINLAWEWIALGIAYVLLRNLPRTRAESSVLAGAMVATAFAVSVYGLYQVSVELPALQAQFQRNPLPMLAEQNIAPGTPAHAQFANRLMQFDRAVVDVRADQLAGGLHRRPARAGAGRLAAQPGRSRPRAIAMARALDGRTGDPDPAGLPDAHQEPVRRSRPAGGRWHRGLAVAATGDRTAVPRGGRRRAGHRGALGRGRIADRPARPRRADPVEPVDAVSLGVLAGDLAR